MKKKNKLATSVRPFGIEALREMSEEQATAVNGGQRVFGLFPNPAPGPGGHKHHGKKYGLFPNPGPKPIFGLITNPGSTTG